MQNLLGSSICPPHRGAATLQKRRPSRMILSERVARPPPQDPAAAKTAKRRTNSPFRGMNITEAKIRNQPRGVSAAEQKRQSRAKGPPQQKEKPKTETFKALKMQRALSAVPYERRASIKQSIAEVESFKAFELLPAIQESIGPQALKSMADISPTPIQRLAIPALLGTADGKRRSKTRVKADEPKMQQFLLAAETGSGKTLAYLLPIIDAIKRTESQEKKQEAVEEERKLARTGGSMFELDAPPLSGQPDPTTGRPRAVILVPTAELVDQVGALAKSFSHTVKFRCAMLSASYTGTVIRNRLFSPGGVDVVISTPHLFESIVAQDPNVVSRVTHLVVDEADSLFDRSFAPITGAVLDRATPSLKQLVLCSATIPRSLDSFLHKRFPDIKRLTTPNLHAIPRRVQLAVVDCERDPYKGNKQLACADTIWNIGKEAAEQGEGNDKRVIVFVNEREMTTEVAEYLQRKGIDATALNRDADERKLAETLGVFTGTEARIKSERAQGTSLNATKEPQKASSFFRPANATAKRTLDNVKVLVMTDLGSRGIDTTAVRHVVLYDVPHTSIDFIHRLGRVGRMGRRGRGFVLVGKDDRRDIVREVREGMFMGKALI
ncbi:hypothetical protein MBLNU457_6253t2 [Dothideomycetes sp. NU457]